MSDRTSSTADRQQGQSAAQQRSEDKPENHFQFRWNCRVGDFGGYEGAVADPRVADMAAANVDELGLNAEHAVTIALYVLSTMTAREYAALSRAMDLDLRTRQAEAAVSEDA